MARALSERMIRISSFADDLLKRLPIVSDESGRPYIFQRRIILSPFFHDGTYMRRIVVSAAAAMAEEIGKIEPHPGAFVEMGGQRGIQRFLTAGAAVVFHVTPRSYKSTGDNRTPGRVVCKAYAPLIQ